MSLRCTFLAALSLLAVVARAEAEADLRARVEVRARGGPGRVTFDGVGVGSARQAAAAAFGDALGTSEDGAHLGRAAGDLGSCLEVLWNTTDGRVDRMVLVYTGAARALEAVGARWREVLSAGGARCAEASCFWSEDGTMLAGLYVRIRGDGSREVIVAIER